ncbi:MAG: hypothetical protein ACON5F_01730, partial [Jejuia sp.]
FFIARGFNPPNSIYNSLVSDGDINLLKSTQVKSLLEMTYVQIPEFMDGWGESESTIAKGIESYVIKNYPKFYNKDVYTSEDKNIMEEFILMVDSDEQLKALIKSKTSSMINRSWTLKNRYVKYRDSLIIELEKDLKDN